jgi:hypothetical protein
VERETRGSVRHQWMRTGGVGVVQVDALEHARVARHRVAHLGTVRVWATSASRDRATQRRRQVEAVIVAHAHLEHLPERPLADDGELVVAVEARPLGVGTAGG